MQISNQADIKRLGKIMGVWAHPDDETFSSAGVMAGAIENGQEVVCLTATKGEGGVQDESRWPARNLADIRAKEMKQALEAVGIHNHHWLGFRDGDCKNHDKKGVELVLGYINKYKPDTILTFGKNGFTGHDDHIAVGRWAREAVKLLRTKLDIYSVTCTKQHYFGGLKKVDEKINIFFNLEQPFLIDESACDILFKLPKHILDKKFNAIKAMPSQTEFLLKTFSEQELRDVYNNEAFLIDKN